MNPEREMGEQPIAARMRELNLSAADLVRTSTDQLNFKMVTRAIKGRRLTANVMKKVRAAINAAGDQCFEMTDIFNYRP